MKKEFVELLPLNRWDEPDYSERREELGRDIDVVWIAAITDGLLKQWHEEKLKIEDALRRRDFLKAAQLLEGCQIKSDDVNTYRRVGFREAVLTQAQWHRDRAEKSGQVTELQRTLDAFEAIRNQPTFERFLDGQPTLSKLAEHKTALQKAVDRELYTRFQKDPTEQTAQEYLRTGPIQAMKGTVEAHLTYINSRKEVRILTASLQINWADWPDDQKVDIFLDVWLPLENGNGTGFRNVITQASVKSARGKSTEAFDSQPFKAVPEDLVRFQIHVHRERTVFGERPWYHLMHDDPGNYKYQEFEGSKELTLGKKVGYTDYKPTATVRLNGLPRRPERPDWKE